MTDVFKLIEANGLTLHGDIEHFAALVRADEREACANDWETLHGYDKHGVAATLRARGNT